MSRLDEALRRSGTISPATSLRQKNESAVFDSPWAVSDSTHDMTADRPTVERSPSATPVTRLVVTPATAALDARWKEWLVSPRLEPAIVEQFRRLAATLFHARRDGRLKVIMVTSAVPGEGKTLTALNLALVLAGSYKRSVLLLDADLRRPRLSEAAGLTVAPGLAEALKADDDRKVSLMQMTEHLTLLPAGQPDPEPLSGLTSSRMQQLLEEAAERFDWVIIDTPPVTAATDAGLLGAMVDGTVLVVRASHTTYPAVRQTVETLGRDRIVGVVLNGVEQTAMTSYGNYDTATQTPGASDR
jgi:capsular exopolysaccharide synthesis family protein